MPDTLADVIHRSIQTHFDEGSPGWLIEHRVAEKTAADVIQWLLEHNIDVLEFRG